MSREGYKLTEWAERDRQDYRDKYGDGNCSCHLHAPCGACTHPGHPERQDANDKCWEEDEEEVTFYPDRSSVTVIIQDGVRALYRLVLGPGGWSVVHRRRKISRKRKNEILSVIAKEAGQRISKVRREFTFISLKD